MSIYSSTVWQSAPMCWWYHSWNGGINLDCRGTEGRLVAVEKLAKKSLTRIKMDTTQLDLLSHYIQPVARALELSSLGQCSQLDQLTQIAGCRRSRRLADRYVIF